MDLSRGLAALVVVLLHWPHFFTGVERPPYDVMPMYGALEVFYRNSIWAVDFFFGLSGFVFFLHYQKRIAERSVDGWHYARLRFARLYPLYLSAILLVVVLQFLYHHQNGHYAVYNHFDLWHFGLSVAGISEWGLQDGLSMNGPDWSVSVEAFLYVVFFLACRSLGCAKIRTVLPLVALGLVLLPLHRSFGRGITGFFMGGVAYHLYDRWRAAPPTRTLFAIVAIVAAGWILTLSPDLSRWLNSTISGFGERRFPSASPERVADTVRYALVMALLLVLFPATLVLLALAETRVGHLVKPLGFLGDSSYSVYLLHFPLQVATLLVIDATGTGREVFLRWWSVPAFLGLSVTVGLLSFHFFERPAQRSLRGSHTTGTPASEPLPSPSRQT